MYMNSGHHHLHARKRVYTNLERYPHPNFFKRAFDYLVYFVALFTPVVLLPQVLQLFETKNAGGLSMSTWFLFGAIAVVWTTYGIIHREWPIIISNILIAFLDFMLVIGILMYR
jgi:uncharacterized protein with PQ loop repeat